MQYNNSFELQPPSVNITLIGAHMVEVPASNPLHYRPLSVNASSDLITELQNVTEGGIQIDEQAIRQVARQIISPSQQSQGQIAIAEGWSVNRCSVFLMFQIETPGKIYREVVSGYTDTNAIGHNNSVAPDIRIFVNSVIRVHEQTRRGPHGAATHMAAVANAQVLRPIVVANNNQYIEGETALRPTDLLTGWANSLDSKLDVDTRSMLGNDANGNMGLASNRSNGISSNFLAKTLTSYSQACSGEDNNMANNDRWVVGKAASYAREQSLLGSQIFSLLKNRTSYASAGFFTWGELMGAVPVAPNCLRTVPLPPNVSIGINSQAWGSVSQEEQIAVRMTHAIPAICGHNMAGTFSFNATNMTGPHVVTPTGFTGIFENQSELHFAQAIVRSLQMAILPELFDGMVDYYVIDCSYVNGGFMTMNISINGGDNNPFEMPNYCDALNSLTIATNQAVADNNGHKLGEIISRTFTGVGSPAEATRWG